MNEKKFIGRCGQTRETITYPQRKIEITMSHATIGDEIFSTIVREALREMWLTEDTQSAKSGMEWVDISGTINDFTAQNGVRIRICWPDRKD